MPQRERPLRYRLHRFHQLAHAVVRVIHLVDEDHVRNFVLVEEMQQGRESKGAARLGLADHDGYVGHHQGRIGVMRELDRTGAIQEIPLLAQELGRCDGHFRAHAAGARFRRRVADGVAFLDGPPPLRPAAREQQ